MEKYYNSLTFNDYPPTELLGMEIYLNSIKNLSFQYRTKDNDELIAYIALKQEHPNIEIPNITNQVKGCRILGIYVESYRVGQYQVTDVQLLNILLDEAEFYISGWVDNTTKQPQFDYIWFNIADFNSQDIIERIDGCVVNNGLAYKIIKRKR